MADSSPPEFLTSILSRYSTPTTSRPKSRPFVTLTFAQSLDAKIAGQNGKQLILSGKESMIMTHWMRTMHDAILVGIGTALNDDPQLNTRHLPPAPESTRRHLPRPVILDSKLRLPPTCKLLTNYKNGQGRRPWVLCSPPAAREEEDPAWHSRLTALQDAGARVIQIPHVQGQDRDRNQNPSTNSIGKAFQLPIPAVLSALHELGIETLMVEGGAAIIGSFFAQATKLESSGSAQSESVVDTVVVTVAPTFVGSEGVAYGVPFGMIPGFQHIRTEIKGRDVVVTLIATCN